MRTMADSAPAACGAACPGEASASRGLRGLTSASTASVGGGDRGGCGPPERNRTRLSVCPRLASKRSGSFPYASATGACAAAVGVVGADLGDASGSAGREELVSPATDTPPAIRKKSEASVQTHALTPPFGERAAPEPSRGGRRNAGRPKKDMEVFLAATSSHRDAAVPASPVAAMVVALLVAAYFCYQRHGNHSGVNRRPYLNYVSVRGCVRRRSNSRFLYAPLLFGKLRSFLFTTIATKEFT